MGHPGPGLEPRIPQALRAYFQSLKFTTTAEEYVGELLETLALF